MSHIPPEALLAKLIEQSPFAIWIADARGVLQLANPALKRFLNVTDTQVVGKYNVLQDPDLERQGLMPLIRSVFEEGRTVHFQCDWGGEDVPYPELEGANKVTIDATMFPILDGQGKVANVVLYWVDITQRILDADRLRRSEAHLRTLVNTIPDLVWLKNPDGVYLGCNSTFEKFFGASEEEIMGKRDHDFVDQELADFFRMHDRRAMSRNAPTVNEETLTFAVGGYTGRFETIKTPMRDAEGNLIGVLGVARDISEHKADVEALRRSEMRYKSAQRLGRVGNWEYDLETSRFWGSDEARRLYGFDANSLDFTTEEVERCIPERERVHQALVDLIEKGTPYSLEFEIHPADNSGPRTIKSVAELIRDEGGRPVKVAGVIQDITEQKEAEEENLRLARQLRHAQKLESIGTLAGGIAHDFNNILSSILGYTELCLEAVEAGGQLAADLGEVQRAGRRAKDLVKQILAFARHSDESYKPIRVDRIAGEVIGFLRSTIPSSIRIEAVIRTRALVMGNPTQLHQVFMNLCTNAAHAMDERGGTLTVTLGIRHDNPETPPLLAITVADTGPGMSSEVRERIFEPYFTTKAQSEGTGMGLAVVHGIVQAHKGLIFVESESGQGTRFTVLLPTVAEPAALEEESPLPLPGGTERILVVDDEEPVASVNSRMLERLGYTTATRPGSLAALELIQADPLAFDLVLSDMTMPELSGADLARRILEIRPGMPIILCSGFSRHINDDKARSLGIRAFVHKPIEWVELATTVRRVLDRDAAGRAPDGPAT